MEKRLGARDDSLYETVDQIGAKLRSFELSEKRRDEEIAAMRNEIREANSSLPQLEPISRSVQLRPHMETADSRTTSTPKPRNSGNPTQEDGVESGEDELLATLDRIAQLATERENK